jgi:hypothetical protein
VVPPPVVSPAEYALEDCVRVRVLVELQSVQSEETRRSHTREAVHKQGSSGKLNGILTRRCAGRGTARR